MPKVETFNREFVIQEAVKTFHSKGYNLTSMQDLVDATGLNRSSIYNSFGSKLDLYIECLHKYQKDTKEDIEEIMVKSYSSISTIQRIFCLNMADVLSQNNNDNGCFFNQCTTEMANHEDRIKFFLIENQVSMVQLFEDIVEQGQKNESINKNKNASEYAIYLVTALQGLRISGVLMNDNKQLKSIVETILSVLE